MEESGQEKAGNFRGRNTHRCALQICLKYIQHCFICRPFDSLWRRTFGLNQGLLRHATLALAAALTTHPLITEFSKLSIQDMPFLNILIKQEVFYLQNKSKKS